MIVSFPDLPTHASLNSEAISILIQHMGIAKTVVFLSDKLWQPTDYLEIKEGLFREETTESVYQKIVDWRASAT